MAGALPSSHMIAAHLAAIDDRLWFIENFPCPLRMRASMPFEWPQWDESGHLRSPFVIVFVAEPGGPLQKRTFYANKMPDQDLGTLIALWNWISDNVPEVEGGPVVTLNPVQGLQLAANVTATRMRLAALAAQEG